jgi:hypothetical protein
MPTLLPLVPVLVAVNVPSEVPPEVLGTTVAVLPDVVTPIVAGWADSPEEVLYTL